MSWGSAFRQTTQNYFPPARIENTCYSSHHENMVHHSTIRPASYKGYGCNNAKPPRPPHCNTISMSWYSGVVRFLRAIERRHCLMGCIFGVKFSRQGGLIPWPNRNGRTKLDRLSRSKKSTIPQSTVGGLFYVR